MNTLTNILYLVVAITFFILCFKPVQHNFKVHKNFSKLQKFFGFTVLTILIVLWPITFGIILIKKLYDYILNKLIKY